MLKWAVQQWLPLVRSQHTCAIAQLHPVNFFSSFLKESVPLQLTRDEGSGVTVLQGKLLSWLSGLCHNHKNQSSCHGTVGVFCCFFKKSKTKPPVVPGLLPSCFYFSNLKMRQKKAAKCILVCHWSQDWTFNFVFIHHHWFCLQICPEDITCRLTFAVPWVKQ